MIYLRINMRDDESDKDILDISAEVPDEWYAADLMEKVTTVHTNYLDQKSQKEEKSSEQV